MPWALVTLVLAGCQPPHQPDQLVVASRSSLDSVDPVDVTSFAGGQLLSAIGDPLYASDAAGQLQPRLATALPQLSADGRRARIPLRQGVRFHDGTPFNAAAMVFSLERFRALGKLSYLLDERISAIRASGPYELELRLTRPYGALAALLSSSNLTPVSPAAYRQHRRRSLRDRFVGTGPYQLVRSTPQQQTLRPFSGYWGPAARNRGVQVVTLSNSTALYGALISGEVDLLLSQGLESDQQRELARRSGRGLLVQTVGPAVEIGYLTLLSDRPPLDHPQLRRAVALSLDRRLISERVSYGMRSPLRSLVPPPLPGSSPPSWPAYGPQQARSLLRGAGYCNGRRLSLPLTFRSNVPADRLFALTWQAQLQRDLGDCLQLEITGVESTTAYRQLDKGAFPMIVLDWAGDYPAADVYVTPMLACSRASGYRCLEGSSAAFGSFWAAPGLQRQLQASEALQGPALARRLDAIQRRVADGAAYIPLWQTAPRAWAQPALAPPVFDGSGRVVLQQLHRRRT
ncbi:MAG: ABC transporter substrate-binding protein [Vulcanococcus sp.]